jgi:hypothetical protein
MLPRAAHTAYGCICCLKLLTLPAASDAASSFWFCFELQLQLLLPLLPLLLLLMMMFSASAALASAPAADHSIPPLATRAASAALVIDSVNAVES